MTATCRLAAIFAANLAGYSRSRGHVCRTQDDPIEATIGKSPAASSRRPATVL
jgi:hypothetical protein